MSYLRTAWYMAGWSHELTDAGFAREVCGRQIYFYRLEAGKPAAILNRCPHRFAPLSLGTRTGDVLVCPYHGLGFDTDGKCVRNPFSDRLPTGASIPTFAVCEKDGIIWMWGGDPAAADYALVPDFSFVPDRPGWRTITGYTLMEANYEYGTDNLLDLSHIEFVHKGSFAGEGVIFAGEHSVRQEEDTLHSNWWMPGIPPPSVGRAVFPPDALVDHWLEMRWNAPASMRLNIGVCPHDAPREAGFDLPQAHILTPANDHQAHYFWSSSRPNETESAELDAILLTMFRQAFDEEDKPIIEAAYANVRGNIDAGGDFWAEKPISLGIDRGGAMARRMLEKMIAREA